MLISFNTKFDFFIILTAGKLPFFKKSLRNAPFLEFSVPD